jgi:hypothetical protein
MLPRAGLSKAAGTTNGEPVGFTGLLWIRAKAALAAENARNPFDLGPF